VPTKKKVSVGRTSENSEVVTVAERRRRQRAPESAERALGRKEGKALRPSG